MQCRPIYVIVASSTKNKLLERGEIKFMRSIDPESLDYETEEGVMNCFGTLGHAKQFLGRVGEDKKVSIIAFSIPVDCILSQSIRRKGYSKRYILRHVYERSGYRNYLTPVSDGDGEIDYLVLTDISCLVNMFDPENKNARKKAEHKPVIKEKPKPEIKRTMPECVQAQTAEPVDRVKQIPFLAGLIIGIILGLIIARAMGYHPFMTMVIMPLLVAVMMIAWIYYDCLYRKK